MNNTPLILVIGFLGTLLTIAFLAITLLVPGDKTLAYVGLGAVAGLFIPQLMTFKSSTDNAVKLEKVEKKLDENTVETTTAKKDTKHAIEIVTMKQDQTNGMVDGHLSMLTDKIDALAKTVARMEAEKVVKAAETEKLVNALTSAAPSGSTPAHGTPIGGASVEGATVITIDPPEAATITSIPPKGKRPRPGDQQ